MINLYLEAYHAVYDKREHLRLAQVSLVGGCLQSIHFSPSPSPPPSLPSLSPLPLFPSLFPSPPPSLSPMYVGNHRPHWYVSQTGARGYLLHSCVRQRNQMHRGTVRCIATYHQIRMYIIIIHPVYCTWGFDIGNYHLLSGCASICPETTC